MEAFVKYLYNSHLPFCILSRIISKKSSSGSVGAFCFCRKLPFLLELLELLFEELLGICVASPFDGSGRSGSILRCSSKRVF